MKKTLSLILAIVMIIACMGTVAFAAAPGAVDAADASWQVKTAKGEVSWIANITNDVLAWAITQEGGVTFTALKDVEFGGDVKGLTIAADWNPANPIVIDFNGYKVTPIADDLEGALGQLTILGDGNLTMKNGYVVNEMYNSFIVLGVHTPTNECLLTGGETDYACTINLENMYIHMNSIDASTIKGGQAIIDSHIQNMTLNVKNSTLSSVTSQFRSLISSQVEKECVINIESSILYAPQQNRAIRLKTAQSFIDAGAAIEGATSQINIKDTACLTLNSTYGVRLTRGAMSGSVFVNGAEGTEQYFVAADSGAVETMEGANWVGKTPFGEDLVLGAADASLIFGNAPTQTTIPASVKIDLPTAPVDPVDPAPVDPVDPAPVDPVDPTPDVPSTDVPDTDVPATGVSIAALTVLATVSLAGVAFTARKKED